ncbi:hypothetical protein Gogos_000948, partial [Gossypium gossypioides]|nr:hypothetical protein [Gossypium gossypioides]
YSSFCLVIQVWKLRLGVFTRIIGWSWICYIDGSKIVHFATIHTSYRWIGTI